jgi:hypothetical protein
VIVPSFMRSTARTKYAAPTLPTRNAKSCKVFASKASFSSFFRQDSRIRLGPRNRIVEHG